MTRLVQFLEPGATWMDRFRLERLVVAHDGVAVWEVTDLRDGRRAELGIFERGSAVLAHGAIDHGTFVVIRERPRAGARLELVEITDEDAIFDEPPSRRRGWLGAAGVLAGIAVTTLGLYLVTPRPAATSEATVTSAPIEAPKQVAAEQPPATIQSVAPQPATRRHATPMTRRPRRAPRRDPLTL